jgi:hypothetical protein
VRKGVSLFEMSEVNETEFNAADEIFAIAQQ